MEQQAQNGANRAEHHNGVPPSPWWDGIHAHFPPDFLQRDPDLLIAYGKDWTRVYAPAPTAVVFPRSTDEVARFLALCNAHQVAVVPSGGRTGLAGGAVAANGEVVLSLDKMRRMDPVCSVSRTVRVQAGAVTAAVHAHCAAAGLSWPIDFAATGTSQIGGNIATNAGGIRVVRYGLTRQWVLGLQVVTMDGSILDLNGALEKNNTGIDLRQLFIGSEGILGVITEATLKLAPLPAHTRVALLGIADVRAALRLLGSAHAARLSIMAFEYLTDVCMQVVLKHRGMQHPLSSPCPAYALVEIEGDSESQTQAQLENWLEQVFAADLAHDGVMAQSQKDAQALWTLREGIGESLAHAGFIHKNDVALPVTQLADFVDGMQTALALHYPDCGTYVFGHVGDGNLHINVMKPEGMANEQFLSRCHQGDDIMFALVQQHQGSVSAEHGIGLLKKDALHFSRSPKEIALFRAIKHAFDSHGLLNPHKIFDMEPS